MLRLALLTVLIIFSASGVRAEDDFSERLALAKQMLELNPAQEQLESAVNSYIQNYMFASSDSDRQIYRSALLNLMNPRALEKAATDAYAETYTQAELKAMIEYYSKPEAKSAQAKKKQFDAQVSPHIVEMLDKALMRLRTASQRP